MATKNEMKSKPKSAKLNHVVFWPPFLLLLGAVVLNFVAKDQFKLITETANDWVLTNFGWLFTTVAFLAVLLCIYICFSPMSKVRLGGPDAKPLMHMWNWFAITVCTTIAVGILLWATAEPIYHLTGPPGSKGIEANSPAAASFAMSTMYLHWTFTPYAIYAVASLMFAFAYYNMKKPYSLGSPLTPVLGDRVTGTVGNLIDAVCLYSLVAGMAASLGGGILILGGGLNHMIPAIDGKSTWVWAAIAAVIIVTFVVSSATGLMKGIRILSSINTYALFGLAIFVFIFGPTIFILNFGLESFGTYFTHFVEMNLFTDSLTGAGDDSAEKPWTHAWTTFYWAVWLAWTPITACFLGQIAYGRTVREFMLVNFILPAMFGACWMAIFSGTALHLEMFADANFVEIINDKEMGTEQVAYSLFNYLPMSGLLAVFYIASTFICFVTSADSNTTAMAAISSSGITPENSEGGLAIKIAWGVTVGLVAWVMISFADINGIKIISTLGGFPAAILVLLVIVSLFKVATNVEKYDTFSSSSND